MTVILPITSFLAAALVLLPLPGHWRAGNVPTVSIIIWLFAINFIHGLNSIFWAHSIEAKYLVWCDIVTRIMAAGNIAFPTACFCLCMHLERVASIRAVQTSSHDKKRRMIIDITLCWVVPAIYIALYYIVQGHRFDIIEDLGCRAEEYVSIPQFFIVWFLPIVFSLGTFVFAGLSFTHFFRRRATFARHLSGTSSGLSPSRYFRLMTMAIVLMFWTLFVIGVTCWFNYRPGLRPWTNWDDVHSNFSRIGQFPNFVIPESTRKWALFFWFVPFITSILFIAFFAFGKDAMNDYYSVLLFVIKPFRKGRSTDGGFAIVSSQLGNSTIPTFIRPPAYSNIAKGQSQQTFSLKSPAFTSSEDLKSPKSADSFSTSFTTSTVLSYYDHYVASQSQEPLPSFTYTHNSVSSPDVSSPPIAHISKEDRLARAHCSV
ncbi:G-protein coupled receptor 4 family protein [Abortiporus biennis]